MTDPSPALKAALALHQSGNLKQAESAYRALLVETPDDVDALHFLGLALHQQGRSHDGVPLIRQAVDLAPHRATFWFNLGTITMELGELDDAAEALGRATVLDDGNGPAWLSLGTVFGRLRRYDDGLTAFERAEALGGGAVAASGRSACLWGLKRYAEAAQAAELAVAADPSQAGAHINRGNALQSLGRLHDAEQAFSKALALTDDDVGKGKIFFNLANLHQDWGRAIDARYDFERALAADSDHPGAADNLMLCRLYDEEETEESLYHAHEEMARSLPQAPPSSQAGPAPSADRPLRVGYVSADFRRHSCAYFLEPVLDNHDPEQITVFCYSSVKKPDDTTERLKAMAGHWRDILTLSDEAAARLIRDDGLDILVDLSGRTSGNRLGIFARRAAPVQVTWLGYPATTGLDAMDWRLTDSRADPPGDADRWHTEKLYRLEPCFHAYRAPADAPAVSPLPALENGHVTFGSFNNLTKVTPRVVALWSDILKAVPGSRLVLKGKMLDGDGARDHFSGLFVDQGIDRDRLDLWGWISRDENPLAAYHGIDIGLDPFPYNGTTTTCEALWMGVPVVNLRGQRHAARVGDSLLSVIGADAWVVDTPDAYREAAVTLAADITALGTLRAGLRGRVSASALCDEAGFTRALETAYRDMVHQGTCP